MTRARDVANTISIYNAKGDLVVATADNTVIRQEVGANGTVLTADSAQSDGVKWSEVESFSTSFLYMGA